jgi:two-component system invasion response regulator UvrY
MRILIADDHTLIREGLRKILAEAFPFAEITDVPDSADLLKNALMHQWDIIISDISMPGHSGIEILKQIKEHAPQTPVLILSMHAPEQYAVRSLRSGASGYLTKESAPFELVKAVKQILSGRKYITSEVAEVLSDREFEVFKMIVMGQSISSIGEQLSLNVNTISTYRGRILEKMNMKSNADLVKYAILNNII